MSRRKQAKPRAVLLKQDEQETTEMAESLLDSNRMEATEDHKQTSTALFDKLQMNDEESLDESSFPEGSPCSSDTIGTDPSLSWNSAEETVDEDQNSLSPSSCATPNSVITEGNDPEINFTIGPTESTPYSCQFCEKSFPRLSYLKKHEQSHSDQMPFKCDFCQRLFKHKRSRDRHVKLHTGDKKYRCPHCESAFSRSDHLKIHMKTHDNQKPYQCVICNRGYNTAAALTSHMQNHKKESLHGSTPSPGPFRCLQCTGTFLTGEELQTHVSHQHRPISSSTPEKPEGGNNSKRRSMSPRTPSSSPNSSNNGGGGGRIRNVPDLEHSSSSLMLPFPITSTTSTLTCIYCTKDTFTTLESLQLHVQAMHGSLLNGDSASNPHHMSPIGTPPGVSPTESFTSAENHFACQFCIMKFPSLTSLHKHSMSVHSLSGYLQVNKAKENAFCAQCAIAFPNSLAFAEHFLIFHTNSSHHPVHPQHGSNKPTQVCSPEPPQVKPTDLSNKSKVNFNGSSSSSTTSSSSSSSSGGGGGCNNTKNRNNGAGSTKRATTTKNSRKLKKNRSGADNGSNHPMNCSITIPSPSSRLAHQQLLHSSSIIPPSLNSPMSFGPHSLLCNQCNAGFPDFESFRTHLKSHLEEVTHKFICDKCESEYETEEQLESHGMAHYLTTTTEYGCQSCLKLFGKPDELQKHLMDIHAHHLYRCALCKEMFDSKVSIQVHFAVKHSNECKLFRCTTCTTMFRSEIEFQVHVKMAHLRKLSPYRCLLCNATFGNELDLQFHLSTHQKQFRCKLCDEAFHVEFLLDKHIQTHHMNGCLSDSRGSPSSTTGAGLTSAGTCAGSSNHMPPASTTSIIGVNNNNIGNSHVNAGGARSSKKGGGMNKSGNNQSKELKCDICDKIIGNELELTSHRKQVHHISITSPLSTCPTTTSSNISNSTSNSNQRNNNSAKLKSSSLVQHQHGSLNPISNGIPATASNATTTTTTLSLHCAYCNENCKNRSDLENHMKTHQIISSGKHKCNICDEVCPTATLLAEHKLTHCKVISGSNCTGCKQNIGSEEQFYSHMRQHCTNVSTNNNSNNNNNNSTNNSNISSHQLPMPCIVCRQTLMTEIEIQMHAKFHTKHHLHLENNNNNMMMLNNSCSTMSYNGNGNLLNNSVQCIHCHRFEDKSQFLVNGFSTNGLSSHICQDCFRKRNTSNNNNNSSGTTSTKSGKKGRNRISSSPNDEITLKNTAPTVGNDQNKSKTYQCIKCQMSFNTEDEIQSHVTTHLLNEGSSHECHLCTQIAYFDSPMKLQCHLIQHTFAGCSSYTCYMCSAVFTTASGLQQHIFEHGLSNKIYDCSHCHLKFYFRAELENHIIVSHDDVKRAIMELERYSTPNTTTGSSYFGFEKQPNMNNLINLAQDFHGFQQQCISQQQQKISQSHKGNQKRKKFFYRSDDSDEEMMESQSGRESVGSNTNTNILTGSNLGRKTSVKEESLEQDECQNDEDQSNDRVSGKSDSFSLNLTKTNSVKSTNIKNNCDDAGNKIDTKLKPDKKLRVKRRKRRASKTKIESSELQLQQRSSNNDDDDPVNGTSSGKNQSSNNCNHGNRAHQQQHEYDEDDNDEMEVVDDETVRS